MEVIKLKRTATVELTDEDLLVIINAMRQANKSQNWICTRLEKAYMDLSRLPVTYETDEEKAIEAQKNAVVEELNKKNDLFSLPAEVDDMLSKEAKKHGK